MLGVDLNRRHALKNRLIKVSFVSIVLVIALGLGLTGYASRLNKANISNASDSTDYNAPLVCQKIYDIGQWSWKRYGGARNVDLKSSEFAVQIAQTFIEKLDPLRLVFTDSFVEGFKKGGPAAWQKVVSRQSCDYFDALLKNEYVKSKKEFFSRLEKLNSSGLSPTVPLKTSGEIELLATKLPKFVGFAKDEPELSQRLALYVEKLNKNLDPNLLKAYKNDRVKILSDSFDQAMFAELPHLTNLLAKSMLGALDPYSTFFSTLEFEEFYHELAGGTSGIGVKVRKVPSGLLIEKVTKESPAARSKKVFSGDVITALNGISLEGLTLEDGKKLLKGKENTPVEIKILSVKNDRSTTLNLKREVFTFEDARITKHLLKPKKNSNAVVAVIEIPSFYGRGGMDPLHEDRSSSEDLKKVIDEILLTDEKPRAIVLDLRGNPGGFLEEAVSMAGFFIGNRPVVGVVENNTRRVLVDERKEPLYTGSLVVLQDEGTASASEVLAGALKDHGRAIIVGSEHSFGKGSVQRLFHLNDEIAFFSAGTEPTHGVVKLTTSIFYSPLGHSPAAGGVKSQITLPENLMATEDAIDAPKIFKVIPEAKPFLQDSELRELVLTRGIREEKLSLLEAKSDARLNSTEEKSTTGVGEPNDAAMFEAAAVAIDAADFDQNPKPISKNSATH
jgi:C-terminal peptidase prc